LDIEQQTGLKIGRKQRERIKAFLAGAIPERLTTEDSNARAALFKSARIGLIAEWEKQTGQTWPTYSKDVLSNSGKLLRSKGARLDAHEIIPNKYGSPHQWWNIHPSESPVAHQGGIHRADGPQSNFFPRGRR